MPKHIVGDSDQTEWSTCTIARSNGRFCDNPVPPDAPISACEKHLTAAFLYCENRLAAQNYERLNGETLAEAAERRRLNAERSDRAVVYYVRIGEHIKIGTTTRLSERMTALNVDFVLATEPGGYELETRRHRQFASCQAPVGREYFYETAELREHITELQRATARRLKPAM